MTTRPAAIAIGAALSLAACSGGDDADQAPAEPAVQEQVPSSEPIPTEPTGWISGVGGPGAVSIAYSDGIGGTVMEIQCLENPARLQVRLPRVEPIGSEERLTFGVGGRLVAMVAGTGSQPGGVVGETPLTAELVASLAGGDFGASYGAEVVEVDAVPPAPLLTTFSNGCEAAMADRAASEEAEENADDR